MGMVKKRIANRSNKLIKPFLKIEKGIIKNNEMNSNLNCRRLRI
jgi:hypothetical protein